MYIARKTVSLILALFLFSFTAFMAFRVIPGDAVTAMLGTEATPEQITAMREELGYTKPLPVQYWNWASGFVKGDLGTSLSYRLPVSDILREKIPVTAVGIKDRFGEVGKLPYLRETMGLTVEEIVKAAKKAVSLK